MSRKLDAVRANSSHPRYGEPTTHPSFANHKVPRQLVRVVMSYVENGISEETSSGGDRARVKPQLRGVGCRGQGPVISDC
ncbi:unnamed protein product [Boreogadus saida]